MTKVYPDHTLENALRERGINVMCFWEVPGPKNTSIEWMVSYGVNGAVVLVQTYKDGGWEAYTHSKSNKVDDTIADVLARIK